MERVISVCTVLGKEQYIQRHDTVCAELHCNIWNGSYWYVQYWEKNSTYRDMLQGVLNCTVIYVRK